ncbi:MAG: protoporphyrinogen oxidase [Acidobacteria bacterium]|nr:protoporphyrinogen oxidase [Acidobacteriota bacterium]
MVINASSTVLIAGGGISGLATAYFLEEHLREPGAHCHIRLLESSPRLGGILRTDWVDGFVVEAGPDSFLSQKPWGVELCRKLGLEDSLQDSNDRQRKTFIVRRGRLVEFPAGFVLFAPSRLSPLVRSQLLSWPAKCRALCEPWISACATVQDESIGAFVRRRFGSEFVRYVAQPLIAGVYGGDVERLSLRSTFPQFQELEQEWGSVVRGLRRAAGAIPQRSLFVTLRSGMGEMASALREQLRQTEVQTGRPLIRLRRASSGHYRAEVQDEPAWEAQAVVLAIPSHAAARILEGVDEGLSRSLGEIPYASSATISLAYRPGDIGHPLNGFGFLAPQVERCRLLACTWTHVKFPGRAPRDHALLRAFVGGSQQEELLEVDDDTLILLVREELKTLLGIRADPLFARVYRWDKAMPQYVLGHEERLRRLEEKLESHPGLFLTGNAYRGVGIPDCIREAQETARRTVDFLQHEGK